MALTAAFDLNQAVDNATARVVFNIRLAAELHEHQLAKQMTAIRAAWRNRHLALERELRGIAFPAAHADVHHSLQLHVLRNSTRKDHTK